MNYHIRRLHAGELTIALELALDTFLRYEAPDYGPEGVDAFRRDIIDNAQFHEDAISGKNRMWGAFDGDKLIGLFAMRGVSHICLVFTHHAYHRQGVATALLHQLLKDVRQENPELKRLTLNSSPYGKPFYLHNGFYPTDVEKTINGIRFTAMAFDL
jgi:GNAT superfamily N-acetyltransferase